MKRNQTYKTTSLTSPVLSVLFSLLLSLNLGAQPPATPPPTGPPPAADGPPCWDPVCIPIDGGIIFLIAAGSALGIRLIQKTNSK